MPRRKVDPGFSEARSDNLPRVDAFMVASYLATNSNFVSAEMQGAKANLYPPDGLLTSGPKKHDVDLNPHTIAPDPFSSNDCFDVFSPDHQYLLATLEGQYTMSTGEDEPSSGLNGRLRPRKSNAPSPKTLQTQKKQEFKPNQEKKRTLTPSKTTIKLDDLNKDDISPILQILCSFCDKTFVSKQALSNHTKRVHISISKQDSTFSCIYCNHVEAESNDIMRHMVDSHPHQYFACFDCQIRFPSTAELAEHKQNTCDKQKLQYRNKLRQKGSAKKNLKAHKSDGRKDVRKDDDSLTESHGFNGIVISCELKPAHVHDDADIEDNITTNLILPPSKNLGNVSVIEKNAVIVLDDLQWNKRIPPNFTFQNTDPDQILSRLGVVQRSSRTESNRKDWSKVVDDTNQKFEKCFDTSFYSKVASNVQENLTKFLDGSFNFNPDPDNTIKTRKLKNSVAINTAEGFPILLAFEQYSRNVIDGYLPRSLAPKHKWKWDNLEHDKNLFNPEQLKRDSHINNCIITLVSGLDIWTQLSMRQKFEEKFNSAPIEKKTEKQNTIGKELKEILEKREIPTSSAQEIVKFVHQPLPARDNLDFPTSLGLMPATPSYDLKPAVLSGEWVRPRCYICCACGTQAKDSKSLSSHISTRHPNAQIQYYEIVGELLLDSDILKHLYVPPSQTVNRTRPLRGYRECTKCKKSITLEDLHQHMLDCAGDTPSVRRKVRPRPFGVRKRRSRLPDNTIRKKMRKDMRSRHNRKNHIRPRPKIKTEVGDAETIRKMLADLPAKRHRVMVTPTNLTLNSRKQLDKQRNKLLMKRKSGDEMKKKIPADSVAIKKENENASTCRRHSEISAFKSNIKRTNSKVKRYEGSLQRKAVLNRNRRNIISKTKKPKYKPGPFPPQDGVCHNKSPNESGDKKININDNSYSPRQHGNRSYSNRSNNSDNSSNNNRSKGSENRSDNHKSNNKDNQEPGSSGEDGKPHDFSTSPNIPLKHSIASLTANSETHNKAVQFHHSFLVQQECNNAEQNVAANQKMLFENEAVVTKLDKPPLHFNHRITFDSNIHLKNKLNKPRKGLNDCIAMLKNKLVEPLPTSLEEEISGQCATEYPSVPQKSPETIISQQNKQSNTEKEKKSSIPKMTQEIAVQCNDLSNKSASFIYQEHFTPNEILPIKVPVYNDICKDNKENSKLVLEKVDTESKPIECHINALESKTPIKEPKKKQVEHKKSTEKKGSSKNKKLDKTDKDILYNKITTKSKKRVNSSNKIVNKTTKVDKLDKNTLSSKTKTEIENSDGASNIVTDFMGVTELDIKENDRKNNNKKKKTEESKVVSLTKTTRNASKIDKSNKLLGKKRKVKSKKIVEQNENINNKMDNIDLQNIIETENNVIVTKNETKARKKSGRNKKVVDENIITHNKVKNAVSNQPVSQKDITVHQKTNEVLLQEVGGKNIKSAQTKFETKTKVTPIIKTSTQIRNDPEIVQEMYGLSYTKDYRPPHSQEELFVGVNSSIHDCLTEKLPTEVNNLQASDPFNNCEYISDISKQTNNASQLLSSSYDIPMNKSESDIYELKNLADINDVPNTNLSLKEYSNVTLQIPPAHCNSNFESVITTPLDLSSSKGSIHDLSNAACYDLSTYETYETLDLSKKTTNRVIPVDDITCQNDIVDLSVKHTNYSSYEPISLVCPSEIDIATDLSINREQTPKDLSLKRNNRSLSRDRLAPEISQTALNTCMKNVCSPANYVETVNMSIAQKSENHIKYHTNLTDIDRSNQFICPTEVELNTTNYATHKVNVSNGRDIYDYTIKSLTHATRPELFGIQKLSDDITQSNSNPINTYTDTDLTMKQVCDSTHTTLQYTNKSFEIVDVHTTTQMCETNTNRIADPYNQYVSTTSRTPTLTDKTFDVVTSENIILPFSTTDCISETTGTSSAPAYNFMRRALGTSANKFESTTPVYTLANACISVTKIDAPSTTSLTNILLSIPGSTITNTTSVYTLAGTTIGTPLNYIPGQSLNPINNEDSVQGSSSCSAFKTLAINDKEFEKHKVNADIIQRKEIHNEVSEMRISKKENNLEHDPETAKKIAMLPKELVEILGTMPVDHRNQLLNVLPQYVSTVSSSPSSTSNISDNIKVRECSLSPIANQQLTVHPKIELTSDSGHTLQNLTPSPQNVDNSFSSISSSPVTSSFLLTTITQQLSEKVLTTSQNRTVTQHNQNRFAKIKELEVVQDRIIDLTVDDSPTQASTGNKLSEVIPSSASISITENAVAVGKSTATKSNNDKTASLRAVRIKTQSVRQKSILLENPSQKMTTENIPSVDVSITEDSKKFIDFVEPLAIQQDEVSSTQKKNLISLNSPVCKSDYDHQIMQQDPNVNPEVLHISDVYDTSNVVNDFKNIDDSNIKTDQCPSTDLLDFKSSKNVNEKVSSTPLKSDDAIINEKDKICSETPNLKDEEVQEQYRVDKDDFTDQTKKLSINNAKKPTLSPSQPQVDKVAVSEDSEDDVVVIESDSEKLKKEDSENSPTSSDNLFKKNLHSAVNVDSITVKSTENQCSKNEDITEETNTNNEPQPHVLKIPFGKTTIRTDCINDDDKSNGRENRYDTTKQSKEIELSLSTLHQCKPQSKKNHTPLTIDKVGTKNESKPSETSKLKSKSQILSPIMQSNKNISTPEDDDSEDDISLAVIVKLKNSKNLDSNLLSEKKVSVTDHDSLVSKMKMDKLLINNNQVTNTNLITNNNITTNTNENSSTSSNNIKMVEDEVNIQNVNKKNNSNNEIRSGSLVDNKEKCKKRIKKIRRNNNVSVKSVGPQNQVNLHANDYEHDINKENNISSESNSIKNSEDSGKTKIIELERNKCSSPDITESLINVMPKLGSDLPIMKDKYKSDLVSDPNISENNRLLDERTKETSVTTDDVEKIKSYEHNTKNKHSFTTLQDNNFTESDCGIRVIQKKMEDSSDLLLVKSQIESVEKSLQSPDFSKQLAIDTCHNNITKEKIGLKEYHRSTNIKTDQTNPFIVETDTVKEDLPSLSIINERDNTVMPLRRSRRGKSLFVDGHLTLTDQTNNTDSLEQKAPFTKKQLIFSKLLQDEENHTKSPPSPTNLDLPVVDHSKTTDSNLNDHCKSDKIGDDNPPVENTKTNKRKKSPQARKKNKKKKLIDCKLSPSQDNNKSVPDSLDLTKPTVDKSIENLSPATNVLSMSYISKECIADDSCDKEKLDKSLSTDSNFEINTTETAAITDDVSASISEKRKLLSPTNIESIQCPQRKKCKLNAKKDTITVPYAEKEIIQKSSPQENKDTNKLRSTACYNKPIAARRIRSKSVVVNSSKSDLYDPYDIDLEDMIEDTDVLNSQGLRKKIFTKSVKTNVLENLNKKSTANKKSFLSPNNRLNDTGDVDSSTSNLEDNLQSSEKEEVLSGNNAKGGFSSDSDDSSKSDVPLKKYAEEKEKKLQESGGTSQNKYKKDIGQNIDNPDDHQFHERLRSRKKPKRSVTTEETNDVKDQKETEEQLRSEQFMESFGFFSERKPRKSNLLATKKISETLNKIANETDDVYFGLKERNVKKSSSDKKHSDETNATKKSLDLVEKKSGKRNRKKKNITVIETSFCEICKKEFRRSDNYLRHQISLVHISKLSEIELKTKTVPFEEEPNYLLAYKQQLDRLKILQDKVATRKNNSLPTSDIILPTMEEILADVKRTIREQQLSRRALSRDEALFLDCCELLKESHNNDGKMVEKKSRHCNSFNCAQASTELELLDKSIPHERCDNVNDGDVDSITARSILESDEVRNLENDLISGLKEAACASNMAETSSNYQLHTLDENSLVSTRLIEQASEACSSNIAGGNIVEPCESPEQSVAVKPKKSYEVKDKMYPDIENIDLFEDKFDKIKRKCRSQAAAAKQPQVAVEQAPSNKARKKAKKKKGKKITKKTPQNPVLTKGALKGFDGIKVSISTTVVNMSLIVPPGTTPPKKKIVPKKKRDRKSTEVNNRSENESHIDSIQKKVDVYEFMDTDDAELFDFRPSTLMERFKNICNKENPSTSKATPAYDDAELSSDSVSDGDDFVYMSDDYVCSDDETENSLMSCELGNNKALNDIKKTSPLKKKDATEKSAVMGKIFKHNAVRSEKKNTKAKEPEKSAANLDQLFDSLLEDEPSSSMLANETLTNKEESQPPNDSYTSPKPYESSYLSYSKDYDDLLDEERESDKDSSDQSRDLSRTPKERSPSLSATLKKGKFKAPTKRYDDILARKHNSVYENFETHGHRLLSKYNTTRQSLDKSLEDYRNTPSCSYEVTYNDDDFPYHRPKSKEKTSKDRFSIKNNDKERRASFGCSTETFDVCNTSDDGGVARQRERRKCTVGKQNVLAETWSSESEPDGVPPRPNSAESVIAGGNRKKRGKKKDVQSSGARRGNNKSGKKYEGDSNMNSRNSSISELSECGSINRNNMDKTNKLGPSSTAHPVTPSSAKSRPRPAPYYWSEGDEEQEQEHLQQHGWIVGDSHKKLVTMLAHAKGRKRNNDDKRHIVE